MSFKLHLIIISCIVVVVMLVWQLMHSGIMTPAETGTPKQQYALSVTHASWGLNCRGMLINTPAPTSSAFANKQDQPTNALREDNVIGVVAPMCNGNMDCQITADEATLGKDPAPGCNNKELVIEYRCFSYDRPWVAKSSSGSITLHCEQPK